MQTNSIIKEKLIRKGAEASLYQGYWFDKEVIFKFRTPKKYRIETIDKNIRTFRTLSEARALIKVKNYGLNVPQVYDIDIDNSIIVMKFIKGNMLKDMMKNVDMGKKHEYFSKIGKYIAILHGNGHVHGDITTSNVIITNNEEVFLIDFGLHDYSDSIEDKSVDIHLFKRVLISSHGEDADFCYESFLEGYREEYGSEKEQLFKDIIKNIAAVEKRGRYVKKEERMRYT